MWVVMDGGHGTTRDGDHTPRHDVDGYRYPLPLCTASLAVLGLAAALGWDVFGSGDGVLLGDVVLALIGAWAGALWLAARREASRLEHLPLPAISPRRRCLYGIDHGVPRLARVRALLGQFRVQAGAMPARRTLDKIRCLRWFASRCRVAFVVLTVAALAMLLVI